MVITTNAVTVEVDRSGEIWFAPYPLFWLWVIIACIQLIRRRIAWPEAARAAA